MNSAKYFVAVKNYEYLCYSISGISGLTFPTAPFAAGKGDSGEMTIYGREHTR